MKLIPQPYSLCILFVATHTFDISIFSSEGIKTFPYTKIQNVFLNFGGNYWCVEMYTLGQVYSSVLSLWVNSLSDSLIISKIGIWLL